MTKSERWRKGFRRIIKAARMGPQDLPLPEPRYFIMEHNPGKSAFTYGNTVSDACPYCGAYRVPNRGICHWCDEAYGFCGAQLRLEDISYKKENGGM
jgi:hypothetical protein